MTFARRRIQNWLIMLTVSLILYYLTLVYGVPLYRVQIWSGWILAAILLFLLLYSLRKKLSLLPIGKTSTWLQFHSYVGILSMLVFFQHISYQLPSGVFETTLALLFLGTALSGILGIVLARMIPRYLTRRGEDVIYERIPLFTYELRKQAQDLVVECTTQTHSTALADYYTNYLADYFYRPKKTFFHLYGSMNYLYVMQIRHDNFCRYLNKKEHFYAQKLFQLIIKKYDLDFHFSLQRVLKYWLFVHVPLTYVLLLAMSVHMMLIYAFLGHL